MHNERFYRPSILAPTWVPSPYQVKRLDQMTSEGINGDGGGAWNPLSRIVVGGSGVVLSVAGGFSGGVTTGKYAPDGALLLGDSDYPTHAARTRKVLFPVQDVFYAFVDKNVEPVSAAYDMSVPGSFKSTGASLVLTSQPLNLKYFPIGASITSVELRFRVGIKPAAIPASLPSFYFASKVASEQKFLPAPATVAAYYNDGLPQSITLVPVTLTTVLANTDYLIQLSDNSQTFNIYHSIAITFGNILSMAPGY